MFNDFCYAVDSDRSMNVGSYDFSKLVHSSAAKEIVNRLRSGETVEFPGRYELSQLKGFGGSWGD
jgi:hypothetical protein